MEIPIDEWDGAEMARQESDFDERLLCPLNQAQCRCGSDESRPRDDMFRANRLNRQPQLIAVARKSQHHTLSSSSCMASLGELIESAPLAPTASMGKSMRTCMRPRQSRGSAHASNIGAPFDACASCSAAGEPSKCGRNASV